MYCSVGTLSSVTCFLVGGYCREENDCADVKGMEQKEESEGDPRLRGHCLSAYEYFEEGLLPPKTYETLINHSKNGNRWKPSSSLRDVCFIPFSHI